MSFTQAQLDAINEAIAEGTLRVKYQDKEVTYRSLDEMLKIRDLMSREISGDTSLPIGRNVGVYGSGL